MDVHALDIAIPFGAKILATRSGVVRFVEQDDEYKFVAKPVPHYRDRRNGIQIRHIDGTEALYGHIRKGSSRVAVGDTVTAGQAIAECGHSNGPHLHFAVYMPEGRKLRTFPFRFGTRQEPNGQILTKGNFYLRPESKAPYPTNAVERMETTTRRNHVRDTFDQQEPVRVAVHFAYPGDFPLRIRFRRPHIETLIEREIHWHHTKMGAWCDLSADDTERHHGTWTAIAYLGDLRVSEVRFHVNRTPVATGR